MQLTDVTLHTLELPLVSPFTTSFSTQTVRTAIVIEATADVNGTPMTGWGECVAMKDPFYSNEYVQGALDIYRTYLVPQLLRMGGGQELTAETVAEHLERFVGHRMAKAGLEMAILDAQLRSEGRSFASYLGVTRTKIPSGVSVGIHDSIPDLLRAVSGYLDEGYIRIKLKIQPGWDIDPVRAVRKEFGNIPLQVDANAAYSLSDAAHLRRLDAFDLLLIEQPLGEDDLRQHAELAKGMTTPMCLDESIVSAAVAADAIVTGAASVINVKPGRVGGYLEARRIHDLARAHGVGVWCGGMLETGIGRFANAALAALPGFTLPGDISASSRFYAQDITESIGLEDGFVRVPTGPGLCGLPDLDRLTGFRVAVETIR